MFCVYLAFFSSHHGISPLTFSTSHTSWFLHICIWSFKDPFQLSWLAIWCQSYISPPVLGPERMFFSSHSCNIITNIVNLSLSLSLSLSAPVNSIPFANNQSLSHILKKFTLDKNQLSNYRPISNVSVISKIIERIVKSRLTLTLPLE